MDHRKRLAGNGSDICECYIVRETSLEGKGGARALGSPTTPSVAEVGRVVGFEGRALEVGRRSQVGEGVRELLVVANKAELS